MAFYDAGRPIIAARRPKAWQFGELVWISEPELVQIGSSAFKLI
jgi:hypothetical protein